MIERGRMSLDLLDDVTVGRSLVGGAPHFPKEEGELPK